MIEILVIEDSGELLYYWSDSGVLDESKLNRISGLIKAIKEFSEVELGEELKNIVGAKKRIVMGEYGKIHVAVFSDSEPVVLLEELAKEVSRYFWEVYKGILEQLDEILPKRSYFDGFGFLIEIIKKDVLESIKSRYGGVIMELDILPEKLKVGKEAIMRIRIYNNTDKSVELKKAVGVVPRSMFKVTYHPRGCTLFGEDLEFDEGTVLNPKDRIRIIEIKVRPYMSGEFKIECFLRYKIGEELLSTEPREYSVKIEEGT